MYAIEPLGVVFPRDADDVAAAVSVAAELGVPVLPARGRHQPRRADGGARRRARLVPLSARDPGDRPGPRLRPRPAGRRAGRPQPGRRRLGLMFGPDTSTANRATLGGMIGNNSAGSHSIRYGMTDRPRARRSTSCSPTASADRAWSRSAPRAEPGGRAGPAWKARSTGSCPSCVGTAPGRDRRPASRPTGGESGGYRLDRLAADGLFDLAQARRRLGGDAGGRRPRRASGWCRRRRHRAIGVGHFRRPRPRSRRPGPRSPAAQPRSS